MTMLSEPEGDVLVSWHLYGGTWGAGRWRLVDVFERDRRWWRSIITGKSISWSKLQEGGGYSFMEVKVWRPEPSRERGSFVFADDLAAFGSSDADAS